MRGDRGFHQCVCLIVTFFVTMFDRTIYLKRTGATQTILDIYVGICECDVSCTHDVTRGDVRVRLWFFCTFSYVHMFILQDGIHA